MVLHVENQNSFVPGALYLICKNLKDISAEYNSNVNNELLRKWFTDVLVPKLSTNKVSL